MALVAYAYAVELNRSAIDWLQPALAVPGFALVGIGLHGLYRRLEANATSLIASVWVGVALGLYGTVDIYFSGAYFGLYAIPAAFVLITLGLAMMGSVALNNKTFGPFSLVPLAVAASGGLWFLVLLVGAGEYRDLMRTTAFLVHVALWVFLGTVLWVYPPGNINPVRADDMTSQGL